MINREHWLIANAIGAAIFAILALLLLLATV